jgi:hypothetical protein
MAVLAKSTKPTWNRGKFQNYPFSRENRKWENIDDFTTFIFQVRCIWDFGIGTSSVHPSNNWVVLIDLFHSSLLESASMTCQRSNKWAKNRWCISDSFRIPFLICCYNPLEFVLLGSFEDQVNTKFVIAAWSPKWGTIAMTLQINSIAFSNRICMKYEMKALVVVNIVYYIGQLAYALSYYLPVLRIFQCHTFSGFRFLDMLLTVVWIDIQASHLYDLIRTTLFRIMKVS